MINRRFMIVPSALPSVGDAEPLEGQARNFPCLLLEMVDTVDALCRATLH
jgi:hypothetical protein